MKTVIVLIALFGIAGVFSHHLGDADKEKIRADIAACEAESGVQPEIFKNMKEGKEFTVTRELDCFSACIFKKNGNMNEDGTIIVKDTDSDAAKDCKKLTGKDACETAGKVMGCYIKNDLIPKIQI